MVGDHDANDVKDVINRYASLIKNSSKDLYLKVSDYFANTVSPSLNAFSKNSSPIISKYVKSTISYTKKHPIALVGSVALLVFGVPFCQNQMGPKEKFVKVITTPLCSNWGMDESEFEKLLDKGWYVVNERWESVPSGYGGTCHNRLINLKK